MGKIRVLILGGTGMLGHKLYQVFSREYETKVTVRKYDQILSGNKIFRLQDVISNVDAFSFETIKQIIEQMKPDVVINCIGIIKQLKEAKDHRASIYINSLIPHLLAHVCADMDAKLIHISTDCVFSGKDGNYTEESISDAEDLYGRSKYLGEVSYAPALTLRTSIIGHELHSSISLVDWFLQNTSGNVKGYTKAIYTGFPTITFAKEILRIVKYYSSLNGLYNVSAEPISKYDILQLINNIYQHKTLITSYDNFVCDRSLNSKKYRSITGFTPVSWDAMITEMHDDYLTSIYQ